MQSTICGFFIVYDITDVDQQKFIRASALLAEVYFAAGARKVLLPYHGLPVLHGPDAIRQLYRRPPKVTDTEYFTAHLMGTCRMDSDPRYGVVGAGGECHELPGVYIADASVMPTPIGVNPQVTIMAIATRIARGILEEGALAAHKRAA